MLNEPRAKRIAIRKKRMRGNHDSVGARSKRTEIAEVSNVIGADREIEQKNMAIFNRSLDAGHENDPSISSVSGEPWVTEHPIVQRDSQRVEAKLSRAID